MIRVSLGLILAAAASAAGASTDFGVRTLGGGAAPQPFAKPAVVPSNARTDISGAVGIGAQWGRVTSTYRSPAHNRRVGGVRNSYHLSGRAIDIARRPGVSHWQIAAAYRAAGYHLIESLDEGDHSHFAFGLPGSAVRSRIRSAGLVRPGAQVATKVERTSETQWRIVTAPRGSMR